MLSIIIPPPPAPRGTTEEQLEQLRKWAAQTTELLNVYMQSIQHDDGR